MKGNDSVIELLNELLAEELTAINQYMVHSEMAENWGLKTLYGELRRIAIVEMIHAEKLIKRILFLEGVPTVSNLNPMKIGKTVDEIVLNDYEAEVEAVKQYNAGIKLCIDAGDNGTAEMLKQLLIDEEGHVDWGEEQRDKIAMMGLENYVASQV